MENLYLGHEYRPHCVQSVLLTSSVKILPYRPPAQLRWPNIVFSARSKGFADARQRAHKDYKITNMAPKKLGLFVLCL